ncbi:MAG: murein biosynthesis integral membrane protein MurJ [Alphaproteobacteria bacterium]|nr:murein biosynthesis integral membrane protein MurJ [Alphaproteobacteria bacterium]
MALLRSVATVGGFTFGSRVLGFVRDVLVAMVLGAGPVADAFFIAFRFPNMFRSLAAEGAFSVAFVPMFANRLAGEGRAAAIAFAERALALMVLVLAGFTIIFMAAMPWLMYAIAPGFAVTPSKFDLAIQLTRITFPYLLFISLVSLLGGVLNSLGRFAPMAAAPMLLNVCLIGALFVLAPLTVTPGHALSWGVAVAGIGEFLWLIWACRAAGVELRLPRPRLSPDMKLLLKRMLPAAVGAGVIQLNLLFSSILASLLPDGAVSYLAYADRVNQLPLGVIGAAIGTALLPLLATQLRTGADAAAMASQNRALEFALLMTVPAAAALVALADPIIVVLFERGAFGPKEAAATGIALAAYATGLPAYVMVKVFAPGFFAREDTATPVRIAIWSVIANVLLNLALMPLLGHVGLALGTSMAAWLNAGLLAWVLHRRGLLVFDARLRQRVPRLLVATAAMLAAIVPSGHGLAGYLAGSTVHRIAALAALILLGLLVFAFVAQLVGAARLAELGRMLKRSERPEQASPR